MKGALSSKPNYQFDELGNLVGTEDDTAESLFLKESIVLYIEGHSANHPADVAASNAPEDEIPPEALSVSGARSFRSDASDVEENDMEEVEEGNPNVGVPPIRHKGRRGR